MKVSTWLICVLTSLVPSATWKSMSSYFSASARADSVMPAIQPWSAAGAEKPIDDGVAGLVVVARGVVAAAAVAGVLGGVPGTAGDKRTGADERHRGGRQATVSALPRCRHVLSSGNASLARRQVVGVPLVLCSVLLPGAGRPSGWC